MSQQAIDFSRAQELELAQSIDQGDAQWRKSMRVLNDIYIAAGNIVVAGATGIDKSDLPKMFDPGSGRHLRYQAVFTLGRFASLEMRRRALEPLATSWGLGICALVPMTAEEKAAKFEAALLALGPIGVALRDAIVGGGK